MAMTIRSIAAFIAAVALSFIPTAAQAVDDPTTVAVTVGGIAPTSIEQDDQLDIVTRGPIAQIGSAIHTLSTAWSTQSLHLKGTGKYDAVSNPDGIIVPQGWALQYSTDGTNFSNDVPSDPDTIVAVRSRGDVKTKARGRFETTTTGEEVATVGSFGGTAAGDGFNVAFGDGFLLNSWHHDPSALNVECHLIDGSECADYIYTVSGYQTGQASNLYFDKTTDRVYTYVREVSSGDIGVYCLDYSDIGNGNVSNCPTAFTPLVDLAPGGTGFSVRGSNTSRYGNRIWALDVSQGDLLCFDITTNAECGDGLNGFNVGAAGPTSDGLTKARVAAWGGRVYFTVNNKMGCFDPTSTPASLCGEPDSTPIDIPAAVYDTTFNRHIPLPVKNTDGTFFGTCDLNSRFCIDANGATVTMPTGLSSYLVAHPANNKIAGQNAQDWAISGTKMYYPGPQSSAGQNPYGTDWSSTIICWDYATDALCSSWDDSPAGIYLPYTANVDPDNPSCVWVNQDKGWAPYLPTYAGKIIPLNAATGEVGCSFGDPVIELPYSSVVPRMSCTGDGRVTAWQEMLLELGTLDNTDISVTVYDSDDVAITGWEDLTPAIDGTIDMSTLSVEDTGLTPSIQITGLGDVAIDELLDVTGVVTFDAEEPEMCVKLVAATNCPDAEMNVPGVPDVPAGIVEGASVTTPLAAGSDVGSNERVTIAGTNTGHLCAASIMGDATKTPELASTGFDPGGLALGGFGVLAAGLGAVAASRRRRA